MESRNLERMIKLAEDFFETKNDPAQISVTAEVMDRLRTLHPATMTEESDVDGPIAWMLVIPTTMLVMEDFLAERIGERELLERTHSGELFDAIYLCSALILPEHRGKGLARELVLKAIAAIRKDHPIRFLYSWAFSPEGRKLAESASRETGLPLRMRSAR